jgi:hypothetical protein
MIGANRWEKSDNTRTNKSPYPRKRVLRRARVARRRGDWPVPLSHRPPSDAVAPRAGCMRLERDEGGFPRAGSGPWGCGLSNPLVQCKYGNHRISRSGAIDRPRGNHGRAKN